MRVILPFLFAFIVVGCKTTPDPNPVGWDVLSQYTIAEYVTEVPETTHIWWGSGEREYAESVGCEPPGPEASREEEYSGQTKDPSDCDYNSVIKSPEAKQYLRERVEQIVSSTVASVYDNTLNGDKPAILRIVVEDLFIVGGGQAVLVGGNHTIHASIELLDSSTGNTIVPRTSFMEIAGYGAGGLLALVVEAAKAPAPERLARRFAKVSRKWMVKGPTS